MNDRIVRLALRAYPPAFRRRHGDEFCADTLAQRARAGDGRLRGLFFWLRTLPDLLRSALRLRLARRDGLNNPGTLHPRAALPGGGELVHSLVQDLKFAIRSLVAIPVTSLAIIVTLTLGIGMNSAIFGVVDTVLLQPLDYAQPDELVYLRARAPAAERDNLSFSGGMVNRLRESPRQLQRDRGGGDPATEPDRRGCPGAGADGEPADQGRRLEGTRLPVGEW